MFFNPLATMKRTTWIAILFIGIVIASCNSTDSSQTKEAPKNIPASEALSLVQDTSIITIDVRTKEEVDSGYIEGADLFFDVKSPEFTEQIATLDRSKTYLVYCHSGKRAAKAANILSEAGFNNVYNMTGGYSTWTGPIHH